MLCIRVLREHHHILFLLVRNKLNLFYCLLKQKKQNCQDLINQEFASVATECTVPKKENEYMKFWAASAHNTVSYTNIHGF